MPKSKKGLKLKQRKIGKTNWDLRITNWDFSINHIRNS